MAVAAAAVPYLWVLWSLWTSLDPLRNAHPGSISASVYDVQARAMLHGHLSVPPGSISTEAFVHDGRQYTYFGIFPSLIRLPVLALSHAYDGRLTALSMLAAWLVLAVVAPMLVWRIRVMLRGADGLAWPETLMLGSWIFSVLAGSTLLYLASQLDVYAEDLTWSVALASATFFCLLGLIERPSTARLLWCGAFLVLTNLNRVTTGYACIVAGLAVAAWFWLGRPGPEWRRWGLPLAGLSLAALAVGSAIDFAKFGQLVGTPFSKQLLFQAYGFPHINGGHYLGLRFVPSAFQAYLWPLNFHLSSVFPYVTLPDNPTVPIDHTVLFEREPTASLVPSMPLLAVGTVIGVVAAFRRQQRAPVRGLRLLLPAAALSAGSVMVFGWILERFVADFLPLLILGSAVGVVVVARWAGRRSALQRATTVGVVILLAAVGLVANFGYAVSPAPFWSQEQTANFVTVQKALNDLTGHPLSGDVVQGDDLPLFGRTGAFFIQGDCQALYLAQRPIPHGFVAPSAAWLLVERQPQDSLCRQLLAEARPLEIEVAMYKPQSGSTVTGRQVPLAAWSASSSPIVGVTFHLRSARGSTTTVAGHAVAGSPGLWTASWDSLDLPDGQVSAVASASDSSGHTATSPPQSFTVRNQR